MARSNDMHPVWFFAAGVLVHWLVGRKQLTRSRQLPVTTTSSTSGLSVQMGRLRVHDWDAWMKYTPPLVEFALDAGARTSGDVLKVILSSALPQYSWPPELGSEMREQWDNLSTVVARNLHLPDMPPTPPREERRPMLRLVE